MAIKVGIVDDSSMVRSALGKIVNEDDNLEVVGKSKDVYEARTMIMEENPDVLTLDVEMPKMDGITFLERLMEHQPMPVVMVSSLTDRSSKKGLKALEIGAINVVTKPDGDQSNSIRQLKDELIPKIEAAYRSDSPTSSTAKSSETPKQSSSVQLPYDRYDAVLIGSSTGGVSTLRTIFDDLSGNLPPVLVVQHMPPVFTSKFAERLDRLSNLTVGESESTDRVHHGEALLAPGDQNLKVVQKKANDAVKVQTSEEPKVHSQRPSVDRLFESAGQNMADATILAIVLTGMGKDGRDGAQKLAERNATILAQDESSCTVYGMPKQVRDNVPSAQTIKLSEIPPLLNELGARNKTSEARQ